MSETNTDSQDLGIELSPVETPSDSSEFRLNENNRKNNFQDSASENSYGYQTAESMSSGTMSVTSEVSDNAEMVLEASSYTNMNNDIETPTEEVETEKMEKSDNQEQSKKNQFPGGVSLDVEELSKALEELKLEKQQKQQAVCSINFFQSYLQLSTAEKSDYKSSRNEQKRSSSLKSKKTPPNTPMNHMKKAVRFADAFGLDLADIKTVFNLEDPPVIPPEAIRDLELPTADSSLESSPESSGSDLAKIDKSQREISPPAQNQLLISPCFSQPGTNPLFYQRVLSEKVVLEKASMMDRTMITGSIRVANIHFEKKVFVRTTFNNWASFTDYSAMYIYDNSDSQTNRFSFMISLPIHFTIGSKVQFCICYASGNEEYWDNNGGKNYAFDCYAMTPPVTDPAWVSFV